MKKLRGFTLLESITVIAIIGIMSTAIYNMRNIGKDYTDYKKEAVNTIYKEIEQYLKDSQRNKVWTDSNNITHELSSFQIKFTTNNKRGGYLEIGNTYLYCTDMTDSNKTVECFKNSNANPNAIGTGFYDSKMLITNTEYTAPKKIKDINKFKFLAYSTGKNGKTISIINILPNGDIREGDYIKRFHASIANLTNYTPQGSSHVPQTNQKIRCDKQRQDCTNTIDFEDTSNTLELVNCCLNVFTNGFFSIGDQNNVCTQLDYQLCNGNNPEAAMYMQLNLCLERRKYYDPNINCPQYQSETTNEVIINDEDENKNNTYSFIVYATDIDERKCSSSILQQGVLPQSQLLPNPKGKELWWEPIGKITINTITKKASLERCDEINCGIDLCR